VGEFNIDADSFDLQGIDVNEENIEEVINTLIENKFDDDNILFYIPEALDSIIESNEIDDNTILINNDDVLNLDE
jgi:hypothetical protein